VAGEMSAAASRHAADGSGSLAAFARLQSQLDAASLIASADELPRALEALAAAVAETLGFKAVVVNLYRKAWDDFIVSTVHGDESVRSGLLGATYSWEDWESTLSERFRRGGAYLVYDGDIDWEQQSGKRIVLDEAVTAEGPDAWQSEDEIFVPFHHSDGSMLGIFNVCSPASGLRPTDEDLEVLTLVVRHAARAVQRAQDAANAAAHRRGLEELLRVSSKLTETVSPAAVLQAICSGISQGLGFGRVLVQLRAEDSDLLVSSAGVGIETEDVSTRFVLHDSDLERLLDPAFETEGCYLLPLDQAKRRVPSYHDTFPSVTNGRGPAAWDRHWLVVPLVDRTGARLGAVFADDPGDRLLPTRERLQALRLFANQATSALESSAQYETMRYLADRDPLTKLLNRRAFVRHLGDASARARESGEPLSLVYCDLDGFKAVNDSRGHADGDRLLRAFGEVLTAAVRRDDAAFRMGGDEFALVLEGCSRERALEVVERVVEHLEAECLAIGASFGVAVADCSGPVDSDELLRRADDAMYDAKGSRAGLRVAA
jgi:diguanylate cyclase (GGDEF)-like protein